MIWGLCIVTSVYDVCLILNCFVFLLFTVQIDIAIHEIILKWHSSLSKYKKGTCFGNREGITFSVVYWFACKQV